MKTRTWIVVFLILALVCLVAMVPLMNQTPAAQAEIYVGGELVMTLSLQQDQTVWVSGHNAVTVSDGKIAVTQADCPDGYCMARGFCAGGRDIVCLPNRMVIHFVQEQEIDGVVG